MGLESFGPSVILEDVNTYRPPIANLWNSADANAWEQALARYWDFVRPANLELERAMEALDMDRIRRMDAPGWYHFLLHEYFRWKYTAPNRYATTTRQLRRYSETGTLEELHRIKERLLAVDRTDVGRALSVADEIRGLGTAGASGLLSLMYPETFATMDQFVVKALYEIPDLPERAAVARMNPGGVDPEGRCVANRHHTVESRREQPSLRYEMDAS